MESFCSSKKFSCLLLVLIVLVMMTVSVSSLQFNVGGKNGWIKPNGNQTQSYNDWAGKNRFHIGDSLYFEYENDSVLVVNYADYKNCNSQNPISKFEDGKTVFKFDRFGFFYFISGNSDHCKAGQRLDIRVMVQSAAHSPSPAPSPENGGGSSSWGRPEVNSGDKISVVSGFVGLLVGFSLFV